MSFDPSMYVTKNVTKEFFVIPEDGTPMFLKFTSPFAADPTIEVRTRRTKDGDTAEKRPMEIADCINLQTGEVGRLIGNEVVKSELRRAYPDDGYVDHVFQINQGQQRTGRGGNKYRSFKIVELVPQKSAPEASHESAPKSRK